MMDDIAFDILMMPVVGMVALCLYLAAQDVIHSLRESRELRIDATTRRIRTLHDEYVTGDHDVEWLETQIAKALATTAMDAALIGRDPGVPETRTVPQGELVSAPFQHRYRPSSGSGGTAYFVAHE